LSCGLPFPNPNTAADDAEADILNQSAKVSPLEPVVNGGIWTCCKEAAVKEIAPEPTTASDVLIVGLLTNWAL